ncbi:hypothetical protein FHS85_004831 [Rhodoligotrophos appendicifer]|uniref:hypothetical protein n=1 Tax=Rhodoligotrophos appendicifer TaxID=987056 RepID=UPI00118677FE|nr:hypothetical protein [Rhodoligotrophos appendicifer]
MVSLASISGIGSGNYFARSLGIAVVCLSAGCAKAPFISINTPSDTERSEGRALAPDAEIDISGYLKVDAIYDLKQDLGDYFDFSALENKPRSHHLRVQGRETRISVRARHVTQMGAVRALIEGDFFSGKHVEPNIQMRHVWGEWEVTDTIRLGIGQTWRNFMSTSSGIPTVDYNGPAGLMNKSRNAQLRLTHNSGPFEVALSIEKPSFESAALQSTMPDLTARLQYTLPGGASVLFSSVARYFSTAVTPTMVKGDQAVGWGIQTAANFEVMRAVNLSTSAMVGAGLGNYLLGGGQALWQEAGGKLHLNTALGLFAGATITLTPQLSTNIGWGYAMRNTQEATEEANFAHGTNLATTSVTKETMSIHVNLLWEPIESMRLGLEASWGRRKYVQPDSPGTNRNACQRRSNSRPLRRSKSRPLA